MARVKGILMINLVPIFIFVSISTEPFMDSILLLTTSNPTPPLPDKSDTLSEVLKPGVIIKLQFHLRLTYLPLVQ